MSPCVQNDSKRHFIPFKNTIFGSISKHNNYFDLEILAKP